MSTVDQYVAKIRNRLKFEIDPDLIAALIVALLALCQPEKERFMRRARKPGLLARGMQLNETCKGLDKAGYKKPMKKAQAFCRAYRKVSNDMPDEDLGAAYDLLTNPDTEE